MKSIETELKLSMNEATYNHLIRTMTATRVVHQTNHYFDTNDFQIASRGITLRLRHENTDWLLQCKIKQSSIVEGVSHALEHERLLSDEEAAAIFENPRCITERYGVEFTFAGIENIVYQGAIENHRSYISLPLDGEQVTLECDKTTLPNGRIDYEIEVEDIDSHEKIARIKAKLDELGIAYGDSLGGKYRRFREAIKRH